MNGRKKILVAPLNWGLGHAARCVPIIHELLKQGAEVTIAANGSSSQFLTLEFPEITLVTTPGYEIKYRRWMGLIFQLLLQLPKMVLSYFSERRWLRKYQSTHDVDAIISDNRYGLYSEKIYSIFITHQTCIQMPAGLKWKEFMLYQLHKKFIVHFNKCWIPDYEGIQNLTGSLTHQFDPPENAMFIGPLSRFKYSAKEKQRNLLIVISGPEPERTRFEGMMTEQVSRLQLRALMVCGKPGSSEVKQVNENFMKADFYGSRELNDAFLSSEIIVTHSGYSTVMDLAATKSRAILIPTPGQTEQEYLAKYLMAQKICYSKEQHHFNLEEALIMEKKYSGFEGKEPPILLAKAVAGLLNNADAG